MNSLMRVCPKCFALFGADRARCPKDNAATEDPVRVLIDRTLGSYAVRSIIGEGGMGVVYAGEHTTIGRRVALKVLRPELSLRDDIVDRFVQEARAVNTISHGNIVNVYDFGRTPFGSFYIVMEYLEGKNLRSLIDEGSVQPLERVEKLIVGAAAALAAAHAKGFIHRDVKPENLMLVERAGGQGIKLLDFGIAKLVHTDGSSSAPTTHTGAALGTPQYMCPEQLEAVAYDHRADIYSLGAVAYELLTGQPPYPGRSHAEVRQMQLTQTPVPPSAVRREAPVSRRLDAAVLWALSPDPTTRCGSMEDFLAQFRQGCREAALVPDEPEARLRRPGRTAILTVATLATVLGCGIFYFAKPAAPPPRQAPQRARTKVPRPRAITPKDTRRVAQQLVMDALTADKAAQRILATELLAQMDTPPRTLQAELRELLENDAQPTVRVQAAMALARMKDRGVVGRLDKLMRDAPPRSKVGWGYAEALVILGEPRGAAHLRADLRALATARGADRLKQRPILRVLGRLGDRTVLKALKKHLASAVMDTDLRFELTGYVAAMGDVEARKRLTREAATSDWPTRVKAAAALLAADPEAGRQTLRDALKHTRDTARLAAAVQLGRVFQDAEVAGVLVEFHKSPKQTFRRESVLALGYLDTPRATKALTRALDDSAYEVALAAALGLMRRTSMTDRD